MLLDAILWSLRYPSYVPIIRAVLKTELFCMAGKSFVADDSIDLVTYTNRMTTEILQFFTAVFAFFSEDVEAKPMKRDLK